MVALDFVAGTLELRGADAGVELPRSFRWDARAACHRAPALDYAELVLALRRQEVPLEDHARRYLELELGAVDPRVLGDDPPRQLDVGAHQRAHRARDHQLDAPRHQRDALAQRPKLALEHPIDVPPPALAVVHHEDRV